MTKKVYVGAVVPSQVKQDIGKALKTGQFLNESDFIRQAIRGLLDECKGAS